MASRRAKESPMFGTDTARNDEPPGPQELGELLALFDLLVEAASRDPRQEAHTANRRAQEAAYKFMHAIGGDLPGFEEATRALFARNGDAFAAHIAGWPEDIRSHALALAQPALAPKETL